VCSRSGAFIENVHLSQSPSGDGRHRQRSMAFAIAPPPTISLCRTVLQAIHAIAGWGLMPVTNRMIACGKQKGTSLRVWSWTTPLWAGASYKLIASAFGDPG
jgi:hypothetical protein